MRKPKWVNQCRAFAVLSVALMTLGTITDMAWIRGWSMLTAIYTVGLFLKASMATATQKVLDHTKKWSHQTFEEGFKGGVEQGRAMEAAERFIAEVDRRS